MRIAIGSDHGGYTLKNTLKEYLQTNSHSVLDLGCHSTDSVDYPDYAIAVARAVAGGRADLGIMIDGAGVGSTMAANKVNGVRAALCNDIYTAGNAREHNNANMLVMGSMVVGEGKAKKIADTFIAAVFQGGRHQRRVEKIDALDGNSGTDVSGGEIGRIVQDVVRNLLSAGFPDPATAPASAQPVEQPGSSPRLITEAVLKAVIKRGDKEIHLVENAVVTPLARDYARDHGIALVR